MPQIGLAQKTAFIESLSETEEFIVIAMPKQEKEEPSE